MSAAKKKPAKKTKVVQPKQRDSWDQKQVDTGHAHRPGYADRSIRSGEIKKR